MDVVCVNLAGADATGSEGMSLGTVRTNFKTVPYQVCLTYSLVYNGEINHNLAYLIICT